MNRTTEGPRLKKARNIKENHRSDDWSTASKPLVELRSSPNVNLGYPRDNQKRISKCLQTLETPYVSGVFHFSGSVVECRETGWKRIQRIYYSGGAKAMENYRSGKFPLTFSGYGRIYEIPAEDEENGAENLCHGADKNSWAHRRKETRSDTITFIAVSYQGIANLKF